MNSFKSIICTAILTMTISSTALAGTIVGARTSRTGTIVGARGGTIVGARTGNIVGARTGVTRIDGTETKLGLGSLISENIGGILRLFLESALL